MSKRFQRWIAEWSEENILPHANLDIESNDARALRLTKKMLADAHAAGFPNFEIEEEKDRVLRMIQKAISERTDFDPEAYKLAWQLAFENEDGD
jgi:hypothetical protein